MSDRQSPVHSIDRRSLLWGGAGGLLGASCTSKMRTRIVGSDHLLGHGIRGQSFPKAEAGPHVKTLIVGAGVSGCSAAYTCKKSGEADFHLLDVAVAPGGNSRAGHHGDLSYPWGAHYLPQPDLRNHRLLAFLSECKAITYWDKKGQVVYNEDYLCHDLEERLYFQGSWHEGLIPWKSLPSSVIQEVQAFLKLAASLRNKVDGSGASAFRIPLDLSSRDPDLLKLDTLTFAEFMRGQGWHSSFLAWYLNYCCRDDYGTDWEETSAWAGLHYFAARSGENDKVLTWPEGNQWLIRKLLEGSEDRFTGSELTHAVRREGDVWKVESWNEKLGINRVWTAHNLILALPRYVIARLLPEVKYDRGAMSYAPWMVANCQVEKLPETDSGTELAWDNVPYGSPSLGYVVADHQVIKRYPGPSVLTSYWPLTGGSAEYHRMIAGMRRSEDWARMVIKDLEGMHQGYGASIQHMDIWLWGHGMIQPKPGLLWGNERRSLEAFQTANLAFAHTDMSGISIFEEAFDRGVTAARHLFKEI